MNTCPITYQPCEGRYSIQGLKQLSPRLTHLHPLAYTAEEQLREAAARAPRVSIQGVQPKLSARLSISNNQEEIALPIQGKKRKLTRSLLVDYFGRERLGLSPAAVTMVLGKLEAAFPEWERLIDVRFLDTMLKQKYIDVFHSRRTILMAG